MSEIRNTLQRQIVLETVRSMRNHPTAEQVYEKIANCHPSISKATVYRNLKVLSSIGEILHIPMPDDADRYDLTVSKHYHIKCTKCGSVCDINIPYLSSADNDASSVSEFSVYGHDMTFFGLCPLCKYDNE